MKGQSYVILAIVFVIIIAVFAVTNVDAVEVNYLFWSAESPLILIVLFSVLIGGVITASIGSLKIFRLQRENKALLKENQHLQINIRKYVPKNQQDRILGDQDHNGENDNQIK